MRLRVLGLIAAATTTSSALAQGMRDVEIKTTHLAGGVYMLEGQGGNIGLCVGDDCALLIDDQFAPLTGKILAAVGEQTDQPVKFVINTHWHFDHTGGNENLGKEGAIIVAHDNVRRRMTTEQFMEAFDRTVPPSPPEAVPVVTFAEGITFHVNDEKVDVIHVEPAHTDGDSIICFREANVVHMGDVYFNGMYPFIDYGSGGSIEGMIAAVDRALAECDDGTKVIPGHGPLSDAQGLRDYRTMLDTVRGTMRALVEAGKSRDEAIAAKPTEAFDGAWGGGFLGPDAWVGLIYDGMSPD